MKRIIGNPVGVPNPKTDWLQKDSNKADALLNKPTTIEGYGITNAYTKEETKTLISKYDTVTLQAMYNEVIEPSPERWFMVSGEKVLSLNEEYEAEYSSSSVTSLVIPFQIGQITIEWISHSYSWASAISLPQNIKDVRLPNSIKHIGRNAFADNINIETVNIPSSCQEIWQHAFKGCTSLQNVITPIKPNYELSVDAQAFQGCTNLNNIDTIIDGVKTIPMACFESCGVTNVTISESTDTIENYAFRYNDKLNSITILNSNCTFYDNAIVNPPEGFVMRGYKNSTAKDYALAKEYTFIAIDEPSAGGTDVDLSDYATKEYAMETAITEANASTSALRAEIYATYYNKTEVDNITGDINSALEEIIAIQNQLMGVSE